MSVSGSVDNVSSEGSDVSGSSPSSKAGRSAFMNLAMKAKSMIPSPKSQASARMATLPHSHSHSRHTVPALEQVPVPAVESTGPHRSS